MKRVYIPLLLSVQLYATEATKKISLLDIPKGMSTKTKKNRFYFLIVPQINKVHQELEERYERVSRDIKNKNYTDEIILLKQTYKAKTDLELLKSLKPHPKSITIAQAAMESAWATSRFFVEAKNIFGMWSANPNEPRIAASVQRDGNRTIWLRKFNSIEDSIREYYRLIAKGRSFKEFRETRYKTENPFEIIKKLDKYSEIGDDYAQELVAIIKYNELTKYDRLFY
jgi:Bax protein